MLENMRKAHLLTANKKSYTFNRVIYADSESRIHPGEVDGERAIIHDPYLLIANFCDYRKHVDKWSDYHSTDDFIPRFWKTVCTFCVKGNNFLFAHNVSYDFINLNGMVHLVEAGFRVDNYYEAQSVYILRMTREVRGQKQILYILSSTNFFAASLKELGDTFGIPKMEVDYNLTGLDDVITYCHRDVLILKTAMETLMKFITDEDLGTMARTLAGQAFTAYRHRFMNHEIMIHAHEAVCRMERSAYYGGRVENWIQGEVRDPDGFYKLDVNSMYPYVMRNQSFPTRLLTYRKYNAPDDLRDFIDQGYSVQARVKVVTDVAVFPVRIKDNLVFPIGEFVTYLSTPELEYGFKHGNIVEIYEVSVYENQPIFREYIDYFYGKRMEAKKRGDKVMDYFFKFMMNSLYGKFGQWSEAWEKVADADPKEISVERFYDLKTKEYYEVKTFGGAAFRKTSEGEAFNSFPAIAAHVTAAARMQLWGYIQTAGPGHVYYMDTDSLFVDKQGYEALEKAGELDPTKLGSLKKEEGPEPVFTVHAPKDYEFAHTGKDGTKTIEHKMKGIPQKKGSGTRYLGNNRYEVQVWPKMNSFLRKGKLGGYYNLIRVKELRYHQTKVWIDRDAKARPFYVVCEPWENILSPPDFPLLNPAQVEWVEHKYGQAIGTEAGERLEIQQQDILDKQYRRELRKAVLQIGGIKDKDYKQVPKFLRRKNGYGLDEIYTELAGMGFVFRDTEDLYETLQKEV
jgi:hypothetical protein